MKDPNGNASTVSYNDNFGSPNEEARTNTAPAQLNGLSTFAFPTSGTNAMGWIIGYSQVDYFTGASVNTEDLNGVISKTFYNDALDRPTQAVTAVGTTFERQSAIAYSDSTRTVQSTSDLNALNDNLLKAVSIYDGLGRTIESRKYEANGNYKATQTQYDALGRPYKQSNPFRNNEVDSTHPIIWTTSTFDALGRMTQIETPDGAKVKTAYDGNRTLVTDQAEKKRLSVTNAAGQLKEVWEITPNDQWTETVSFPNEAFSTGYKTTYVYDSLNNLATVNQGGQTRTFAYNNLSRLTSAANRESGTINYLYDSNGNLTQKDDARGVRTAYVYDVLNRVTNRNYTTPNGTPSNYQATPNVSYYYDTLTNAKGRLIKVSSAVSTTEYTSFDILGRVTGHKQTADGGDTSGYSTGYTYKLSGALDEETYPSTRVVKNILDANGDLSIVESKKNANSGYWHFADSFSYNAAGAVASMQLGNSRWESTVFNSRLQPTQIALGTVQTGTEKLKLNFDYGTTGNNGNIQSQTITVPTVGANTGFAAVQTYSYDSLNRLKDATENATPTGGSASQSWKQSFTYDRYGNRNFDQANTTMPSSFANPAVTNPTVNPANNRINSTGFTFDNAGNTITDAGGQSYVYDAENKQTSASNGSGNLGQYYYDGDGKRVKKYVPATGETTIFVYDATGKQIAEYSTIVADTSAAKVNYLTADHLGSPRINTDRDGNVTSRHDYHPFGEEINGTGGRSAGLKYGDDTVRKQFTSYERDIETELNFAQARMFGSGLGRFTSPDPMLSSGVIGSPQTWNRYSYVSNNPLKYVDPLGLFKWSKSLGGDRSNEDINDELNDLENHQEKQGVDNSERIAELTTILSGRQTFRNALADLKSASNDMSLSQNQRDEISRSLNAYGTEGDKNGVNIGQGVLRQGVGAQAQLTGYQYDKNRQVTGAIIEVTIGSQTSGQELVMAVGHEGSHVADDQAAVAIWATTGDYARARDSSATKYETENRAYHISV